MSQLPGRIIFFQGKLLGFVSGGIDDSTRKNTIDKFTFAASISSSDVGDLSASKYTHSGTSSATHGYVHGGNVSRGQINVIERFTFFSAANAADVGDLTQQKDYVSGASSRTHGYCLGGRLDTTLAMQNVIERYAFAASANGADVGDLITALRSATTGSSDTHAWTLGGYDGAASVIDVQKTLFASAANAADVGDLDQGRNRSASLSSRLAVYATPGTSATSFKVSFASAAFTSGISQLSDARQVAPGVSGVQHGYWAGGRVSGVGDATVDRFSYSADTTAADVGTLTVARGEGAGHQR